MEENKRFYQQEDSPLRTKSYAFAVRIVKMVKFLLQDRQMADIYRQVLRSGTSIGANVRESEYAQSAQDFVAKLYISLKEANETDYWLNLLKDTDCISKEQFESIDKDCCELRAMLVSSVKTAKTNMQVIVK